MRSIHLAAFLGTVTIGALSAASIGCSNNASSCSVSTDATTNVVTVTCGDGSSATVKPAVDGTNGTNGTNGTDGSNGTNGTNGANGTNASPCTVTQAGSVTTITCPDGSHAAIDAGAGGGSSGGGGTLPQITVLQGTYVVHNNADIAVLQTLGTTSITGGLIIDATGLTDLSGLSALTHVGGDIAVANFSGTTLAGLEHITQAGGLYVANCAELTDISAVSSFSSLPTTFVVAGPKLAGVSFPNLTTVGRANLGPFSSTGPAPTVSLPLLATVGENLRVAGVPSLTLPALTSITGSVAVGEDVLSFSMPLLATVGGEVSFQGCHLINLAFPALTSIGGNLDLFNTPMLATLSLPELRTVGGWMRFQGGDAAPLTNLTIPLVTSAPGSDQPFYISNFPHLTTVSFPALTAVGTQISVTTDPVLASFSMPLLASCVGAYFSDVPLLSGCVCPSLAAHLPAGTSVSCSNPASSCP